MANTLAASFALTGSGTLTKTDTVGAPVDALSFGANNLPAVSISISDGTGANQCNEWWRDLRTVGASSNDDLDLYGVLTNGLGQTIQFTGIKVFFLAIASPDGTKKLRIGPQGVSNTAQLWFGGVAAGNYEEVFDYTFRTNLSGSGVGWPITSGTGDLIRVNNPGASAVTYTIWLLGTK